MLGEQLEIDGPELAFDLGSGGNCGEEGWCKLTLDERGGNRIDYKRGLHER